MLYHALSALCTNNECIRLYELMKVGEWMLTARCARVLAACGVLAADDSDHPQCTDWPEITQPPQHDVTSTHPLSTSLMHASVHAAVRSLEP